VLMMGLFVGFGVGSWIESRRHRPAPELPLEPQPLSRAASEPLPQPPAQNLNETPIQSVQGQRKNKTPVSICGAPTKSGKPCQRRVRGGGRCYQHRRGTSSTP
jgi:hypothetical protein